MEYIQISWWQLAILGPATVAFTVFASRRSRATRGVYRQYFAAALQPLRELRDLAPVPRLNQSSCGSARPEGRPSRMNLVSVLTIVAPVFDLAAPFFQLAANRRADKETDKALARAGTAVRI